MRFPQYHYDARWPEFLFEDLTRLAEVLTRAKNTPEVWEKIEGFRNEYHEESDRYVTFQSMKIALCELGKVNDDSVHDAYDRLTNERLNETYKLVNSIF